MKKDIIKLICLINCLFFIPSISAQIYDNSYLADLPVNTTIYIKSNTKIPKGTTLVTVDDGQGKMCSCQFFITPTDYDRELKAKRPLSIKEIKVKGLFDGSQMHVFKIYLNGSNDFFKLKCDTAALQIKDFEALFHIDHEESITTNY